MRLPPRFLSQNPFLPMLFWRRFAAGIRWYTPLFLPQSGCETGSEGLLHPGEFLSSCARMDSRGRLFHMNLAFLLKPLWEFQGYEFGGIGACVGYCVRVAIGKPFGVSGLEVGGHGALACYIAAEIQIGDGYYEMWAGVVKKAGLEPN